VAATFRKYSYVSVLVFCWHGHVVVTASRYSRATVEDQGNSQRLGSRGSALNVNQDFKQDVEALVDYIYTTLGLNLDYDYVIPFAPVPRDRRSRRHQTWQYLICVSSPLPYSFKTVNDPANKYGLLHTTSKKMSNMPSTSAVRGLLGGVADG
jgi:hypothetical protein